MAVARPSKPRFYESLEVWKDGASPGADTAPEPPLHVDSASPRGREHVVERDLARLGVRRGLDQPEFGSVDHHAG